MEDLLDVLRDHGWTGTGADYDPVRFLKDTIDRDDLQDEIAWLKQELETTGEFNKELQDKVSKLSDSVAHLTRDLEHAQERLRAIAEKDAAQ